jgi:hypothetical protein
MLQLLQAYEVCKVARPVVGYNHAFDATGDFKRWVDMAGSGVAPGGYSSKSLKQDCRSCKLGFVEYGRGPEGRGCCSGWDLSLSSRVVCFD